MPLVTTQRRPRPILPRRTPIILHNPMVHLLIVVRQTLVLRYEPPSVFRLPHDIGADVDAGNGTSMVDGSITGETAEVTVQRVVLL